MRLLVLVISLGFLFATVQYGKADHGMLGDTSAAREQLSASVHRSESCGSCHGEHGGAETARRSCQNCHTQEGSEFWRGSHGAALQQQNREAPGCVSCHGSHDVRRTGDRAAGTSPRVAPSTCGSCHKQAAEEFATSIHGRALVNKESVNAPSCPTCHGAHLAAPVMRDDVAKSCASCHLEAGLLFDRSVHARGVNRGVLHAPTCTTCHGDHLIKSVSEPTSPVAAMRFAGETCVRCHESVRITEMHDLPVEVVADFRGSFHGLAGAFGDRRVANCASCHGFHDILSSYNPLSRIYPVNLRNTCGTCHPGAGDKFAQGGVHHTAKTFGHRLVNWVRSMYAGMIAAVIGFMLLHNALDFYRRWRDSRHRREQLPEVAAGKEFRRFTVNERVQHWILAASFFTLAASGFVLRFGWRLPWIEGQLQQTARAGIHRAAAVVFIGIGVYHLGYLVFTRRGREMARAILPRIRRAADLVCCVVSCYRIGPPSISDWHEMVTTVKYNIGVISERPAYGRFTYWEKMEYWALVWGAIVMSATGIVLWFETPFLNRSPYWAFDLLHIVHLYEATLAVSAIVVWHFYYVIVNPDVFPLNQSMTRGTLNYEEMLREHSLDTDAISRGKDHE